MYSLRDACDFVGAPGAGEGPDACQADLRPFDGTSRPRRGDRSAQTALRGGRTRVHEGEECGNCCCSSHHLMSLLLRLLPARAAVPCRHDMPNLASQS